MIYPIIEESEKVDLQARRREMADHLSHDVFPGYRVALLHGRMKAEGKDRVMRAFAAGEIQMLVSTTVVEVGVDVPNATVMLVEHAERFGLAQLHQLRGRVGRGAHASSCILIYQYHRPHRNHPDAAPGAGAAGLARRTVDVGSRWTS